jgi:hypothetical protein
MSAAAAKLVQGAAGNAAGTVAKRNAGFSGYIKRADGTVKWGNTAKVAGGAGVAGLGAWALLDPKAADKVGGATNSIGDTFGSALGGLGGGLTEGVFSSFLSPTVLSACCASSVCSCCVLVAIMMLRN